MKRLLVALFLLQGVYARCQDTILLTINDSIKISKEEFVRTYKKNSNNALLPDLKNKDEYLELFINYKLKVQEALSLKLDTAKKFKKEFEGYVNQLAEPYLVDTSIDNSIVWQAYHRMQEQVRTSHILVRLSEIAEPKDTLVAYNKVMGLRNRILAGESFDTVAKYNSQDPSSKTNFGDIGYLSVFNTVYAYENAMYSLKVGELSMPVRSVYGYHLIKVTGRKPAAGEIKMAHVLINPKPGDTAYYRVAKARIDSAWNELQGGASFATVAMKYSDDVKSRNRGGNFDGWINKKQRFPKIFKDIVFEMNKGEYSEPFASEYGWHIVMVTDKRVCNTFEVESPGLKDIIKSDFNRNSKGRSAIIARLKNEYKLVVNAANVEKFAAKTDSSILYGYWIMPKNASNTTVLASFSNVRIGEVDFSNWIENHLPERKNKTELSKLALFNLLLEKCIDDEIIKYEKSILDDKYPDYRYLVQEYHDGMLLFDLTDRIIWSNTSKNEAGLKQYFADNKHEYMWGERVDLYTYVCKDAGAADKLMKMLTSTKLPKPSASELSKILNKKDTLTLKYSSRLIEKGSQDLPSEVKWVDGFVVRKDDRTVYHVREMIKPQEKQLNDCKGQVIADFQKHLEEQWIRTLRKKYKVSIDKAVYNSIQN